MIESHVSELLAGSSSEQTLLGGFQVSFASVAGERLGPTSKQASTRCNWPRCQSASGHRRSRWKSGWVTSASLACRGLQHSRTFLPGNSFINVSQRNSTRKAASGTFKTPTDLDVGAIRRHAWVPGDEIGARESTEHGRDGIARVRKRHLIPRDAVACDPTLYRRRERGQRRRHRQSARAEIGNAIPITNPETVAITL